MSNWTPVSQPSQPSSASRYLGTAEEKELFIRLLEERARRAARRRIEAMYPETGLLSRHAYPKHMEFFKAGASFRERCFMAANRIGKTEGAGGYEVALHLTGNYPSWWTGRRFSEPVKVWAGGKTNETTRDIIQTKLCGDISYAGEKGFTGTGLIVGDRIGKVTWKQGVSDLADKIKVKHASGGWSTLGLKSYQQGRGAFEGTEQDVIWLDEEPPLDIYGECLIRTATTNGIVLMTFTPLEGLSETVLQFLPEGMPAEGVPSAVSESRYLVMAGWSDAPHLSEATKRELLASTPAHLRDARSKGIPLLGDGAIFPVADELIECAPFAIPPHWPQINGIDFGWDHPTASVRLAWDRDSDCVYVINDYKQSHATPAVHADAIKAWGTWIPVSWPHDGNNDTAAGPALAGQYGEKGLNMLPERATWEDGSNSVEAGVTEMLDRMTTGRWKVFSTCGAWMSEKRLYHRKGGKIVKIRDDVLSASRYALMMLRFAKTAPKPALKSRAANWRVA